MKELLDVHHVLQVNINQIRELQVVLNAQLDIIQQEELLLVLNVMLDIHHLLDQHLQQLVQNVLQENILFLVELVLIVQQVNIHHHQDRLDVQLAQLDIIQMQEQLVAQNVLQEHINRMQAKEVVQNVIRSVRHVTILMETV